MDTSIVLIVTIASALFVAVLVWKGIWLLRKISEEPPEEDNNAVAPGAPGHAEPDTGAGRGTEEPRT